jgi:hypothetical protein
MAFMDKELPPEEMAEIKKLLDRDKSYRQKYNEFMKLKEVTSEMKFKKLPEMYWDEYWHHVYNRIERGISWILISLGAIIILFFSLWNFVNELLVDQKLNPVFKIGIIILLLGAIVLLISVVREKLMVKKVDKYREVER